MDTSDRAVILANEIDQVIVGQETAAVYLAIGMVLGAMEGKAERPNLCGLMEIISKVAHNQMASDMAAALPPKH